jgi:2-dehydropantoate 2-reductase
MAAALARAGHPVTIVVRPGSDHPPTIHVESDVLGELEEPVSATERLAEPVDVLWVATKATALEEALKQAPAELVREAVIPLLNGIGHMAPLRATYGEARVAAGTIRVEAEKLAPGRIRQAGPFIVVDLAGPPALRRVLERVAAEVDATGIRTRLVESPEHALWDKLLLLGPFALTSTASGLSIGGIRDDPTWRATMLEAMQEVRRVAAAEGVELGDAAPMIDVMAPGMRSSMQKDAAAGRPLEVDHISGPVLNAGERHGIPTPTIRELVDQIRAKHPA